MKFEVLIRKELRALDKLSKKPVFSNEDVYRAYDLVEKIHKKLLKNVELMMFGESH